MAGFPSPFGGGRSETFADDDTFETEYIPEPDRFLEGHDVLTGEDHLAFHDVSEAVFEERGVYDMTFGYNLARLNVDTRHPGAGYRYAEDADDSSVLRAEFTPTTPFCPQSDTLTKGSFRAWNGLGDRHEYDIVRVRVGDMHHRSEDINATLERLEEEFRETGAVPGDPQTGATQSGTETGCADDGGTTRGYGPEAPF